MKVKSIILVFVGGISVLLGTQGAVPAGSQKIAPGPSTPVSPKKSVCVDFNSLAIGECYGGGCALPHKNPGDRIAVQNLIHVSVNEFFLLSTPLPTAFNFVMVKSGGPRSAQREVMWLNNISLEFDFTGLHFRVREVSFIYADLGGYENLWVNNMKIIVGEMTAAHAPPGVTVNFNRTSRLGTVTITTQYDPETRTAEPIRRFRVGGQRLLLDDVCAVQ